jgi:hypothetical protein
VVYLDERLAPPSTPSRTGLGKHISTIHPCTSYWLHRTRDVAFGDFR